MFSTFSPGLVFCFLGFFLIYGIFFCIEKCKFYVIKLSVFFLMTPGFVILHNKPVWKFFLTSNDEKMNRSYEVKKVTKQ